MDGSTGRTAALTELPPTSSAEAAARAFPTREWGAIEGGGKVTILDLSHRLVAIEDDHGLHAVLAIVA